METRRMEAFSVCNSHHHLFQAANRILGEVEPSVVKQVIGDDVKGRISPGIYIATGSILFISDRQIENEMKTQETGPQ